MNNNTRQILIFITLVIGLSYLVFWGPIVFFKIRAANLIEGKIYNIAAFLLFIIGGFVPSIIGIILTSKFEGKEGIIKLFLSAINIKIGFSSFLIIIVYVIILSLLQLILYTALGGNFDYSQFIKQLPTTLPLIIAGPLSEEFGWRGFLQKRVNEELSPTSGSIIIGIVWSLWHLPLFYMIGTSQHEFKVPFFPFMISIISSTFVYTYVYIKSNGSLFTAILLHWLFTYVFQVIASQISRTTIYNLLECIPALMIGFIFMILLNQQRQKVPLSKPRQLDN
jgi:membrane protease YdiL (CAAX protease family)